MTPQRIKRWTPVLVEWLDAHDGGDGWVTHAESEHQHASNRITTCGLLWRNNRVGITVVHNRDRDAKRIGGSTFIPASGIVRVTVLLP